MPLQFGVFDHIEPVPGETTAQAYRGRLAMIERLEAAGFYAYHLAEHHTPAIHSLSPSQAIFFAAAAEHTKRLRFATCIYEVPMHNPMNIVEEICMLDNLSNGRIEVGVSRGAIIESYFWGLGTDIEILQERYLEGLKVIKQGLSQDILDHHGKYYSYDKLPMIIKPVQKPLPPFWYMRNAETAAVGGMNLILDGNLEYFEANALRYKTIWERQHGPSALTAQGTAPKVGLTKHLYIAETDAEAQEIAKKSWEVYQWNIYGQRREIERRGLAHIFVERDPRPKAAPAREAPTDFNKAVAEHSAGPAARKVVEDRTPGFGFLAGSPETIRLYLDEVVRAGANYFLASFHWGNLSHAQAMRSLELFATRVMPHYHQ